MPQNHQTILFSLCESFTTNVKLVWAWLACNSGFPMKVHHSGISLAMGSPGLPLTSSSEYNRLAWSTPMSRLTTGLGPTCGNFIHSKCFLFGFVQVWIHNLHVASDPSSQLSRCLLGYSSIQTIDRELYNWGVKLLLIVIKHLHSQLMWSPFQSQFCINITV